MNSIYVRIGNNIRRYRNTINMTQEQVAEQMNLSGNYYGKVERGIYHISYNIISDLYNELGWDIDYILTGSARKSNPFNDFIYKCPVGQRSEMSNLIIWTLKNMLSRVDGIDPATKEKYFECLNVGEMCAGAYVSEIAEDKVLYNIRKNAGYTSQKMADVLDMPVRSYSLVEKGKSKPKIDTFIKVNNSFLLNPSYIINGKIENMNIINNIWSHMDDRLKKEVTEFLRDGLSLLLLKV